jgi:hypothetical protein
VQPQFLHRRQVLVAIYLLICFLVLFVLIEVSRFLLLLDGQFGEVRGLCGGLEFYPKSI